MEVVINDFVQLLRRNAVRVSPAETVEALQALQYVGLRERSVVRDTLRATLVKNRDDIVVFDRLFDLYFTLQDTSPPFRARLRVDENDHDHGGAITQLELGDDLEKEANTSGDDHEHTHEPPQSIDLRRYLDESMIRRTEDMHGDTEKLQLSLFAQQLVLNRKQGGLQNIFDRITHQLRIRRARNVFHPGSIATADDAEELPIDISAAELEDLLEHLEELEVDEALIDELKAQANSILEGLPELFKMMQERQKQLNQEQVDSIDAQQRSLRRLLEYSAEEQRELEATVRRLARELHGAHARRLYKDRAGRISVAHTLRQNLRFDGIPFQPVLRQRHEQRPRLVLLCDVSLSTRNLARFWLHLIHQMQSLFSKVRTFVFVADMVEVTHLLDDNNLQRAVETIFGGQLIDVDAKSDFGRAAQQFCEEYLSSVNHRTTVVILGDGRNNGHPPNEAALQEIAQHARTVIWLTPEPRWGWSLGNCDMARYEPYCQRVEVVTTIEQLGRIAEELVATDSSRA